MRADVYRGIHSSPYREHKLHLRNFLTGTGFWSGRQAKLLDRLLADGEMSATRTRLVAALDSLRDLELYIPVPEHFALWNGDTNLIVATNLHDHEIPVAFDLSGRSFPLSSAETPPNIPVLAVVPAETDFSRTPPIFLTDPNCDPNTSIVPCDPPQSGGGPGGYTAPTAPGVWINHSYIDDNFEGFLNGAPEFEVVIASQTTTSGGFNKEVQCAGALADHINTNQPGNRTIEYVYDQNDNDWAGLVKIATVEQFNAAQALDSGAIIMVWEDDNTACRIKRPSATAQQWIGAATGLATGGRAFAKKNASTLDILLGAAGLVVTALTLIGAEADDDFVGLVERTDVVGVSYSDATHAIVDQNQAIRGRLNIVKKDQ